MVLPSRHPGYIYIPIVYLGPGAIWTSGVEAEMLRSSNKTDRKPLCRERFDNLGLKEIAVAQLYLTRAFLSLTVLISLK